MEFFELWSFPSYGVFRVMEFFELWGFHCMVKIEKKVSNENFLFDFNQMGYFGIR